MAKARSATSQGLPGSIAAFARRLRARDFTAREAVQLALDAAVATQEPINAFISIDADSALRRADGIDEALAEGRDAGPLMGVPVAIKDVFDIEGLPTTAGSRALAGRVPEAHATAVSRLLQAGAVIVGKANMDQFAFGPHQDDYGRTNCPADTRCYAGGSSGGSAAAVAAGIVLAALGSDAGGSTRFPAACCGVVGLKGTFGRVSTQGIFPTFPTLDHVGILAAAAADARTVYRAVVDEPRSAPPPPVKPPRLAILADWEAGCSTSVSDAIGQALAELAAAGADVGSECTIPAFDRCVATLIATVGPEAAVVLEPLMEQVNDALPAPLAALLEAARTEPATEYVAAQRLRAELRGSIGRLLSGFDAIVMPTSLDVAWRWVDIDAGDMGVRNRTTANLPLANLTGNPAISVPVPSRGLPVGLQLVGRLGEDEQLLGVATWVEHALWPQETEPRETTA